MSVIFALFALVFSYFGSSFGASPELGFQGFAFTIASMMISVVLLIPIIGLMLGYAAILGEIEKGSIPDSVSKIVAIKVLFQAFNRMYRRFLTMFLIQDYYDLSLQQKFPFQRSFLIHLLCLK